MPSDIKKAAIALVISCISTLFAVYLDGLEFEEISYNDSLTLGINIVWTLIVAWIIWDLFKGKDIKLTLYLLGQLYWPRWYGILLSLALMWLTFFILWSYLCLFLPIYLLHQKKVKRGI